MKQYIMTFLLGLILLTTSVSAAPLPDLSVSLLSYTPNPVQPGQTIDITLEVANEGDPAEGIIVELIEEHPFTVTPTQDSLRAKNLQMVSGTQKLQYRVRVSPDAQDGLTTITARYGKANDPTTYQEVQFNILIETFGARIGIDSLEQVPTRFEPGGDGVVKLIITNYDDQPLKNVDLVLDLTNTYDMSTNMDNSIAVQAMINARLEDVNRRIASGLSPLSGVTPMGVMADGSRPDVTFTAIAPRESATLKRIGTILPGQTTVISYAVQALPDITPGIYAVPLYINYNDEDNNPFHTKTELPILIDMQPELLVQLKSSSLRSTDFAGDVEILVANQGLSELRYVALELVESESYQLITAPSEVYLGTLTAGQSSNSTFNILPHEEDLTLPVKVTFRDSYNNLVTEERMLSLEIINKNYYRDMPYEMMTPWIILGFVLLALTAYYLRKMKN